MRSFLARIRNVLADPTGAMHRLATRGKVAALSIRNLTTRRKVTGDADVVVSLTSYGHRLDTVHLAIESIARGSVLPSRFILWVSDPDFLDALPRQIQRLQARGLEVLPCTDFGPHKKQFVYATTLPAHRAPLVVCDDDAIYPRRWLEGLMEARTAFPDAVLAYRAHEINVVGDEIAPYAEWRAAPDDTASYAIIGTGVGGVLNPPRLLDALREAGEDFVERAPRADDVWVHYVSVRAGIKTVQVSSPWRDYPQIPGTQKGTLYGKNVRDGGNDQQVQSTYGAEEVRRIAEDSSRADV